MLAWRAGFSLWFCFILAALWFARWLRLIRADWGETPAVLLLIQGGVVGATPLPSQCQCSSSFVYTPVTILCAVYRPITVDTCVLPWGILKLWLVRGASRSPWISSFSMPDLFVSHPPSPVFSHGHLFSDCTMTIPVRSLSYIENPNRRFCKRIHPACP